MMTGREPWKPLTLILKHGWRVAVSSWGKHMSAGAVPGGNELIKKDADSALCLCGGCAIAINSAYVCLLLTWV